MRPQLPPYVRRPTETVAEKRERIRAEYAAAGLPWGNAARASNDNAKPAACEWWREGSME